MNLSVETAKLLGAPDGYGWTQVHEFEPDDAKKTQIRGKLFAIISTTSANYLESAEQVRQGREVLTRLHEEYFGSLKSGAFENLGRAAQKVVDELGGKIKVEMAVVAVVDGWGYIVAVGGAKVYLKRNEQMYLLVESEEDCLKVGSGKLVKSDKVLLGTGAFFREYSMETIGKALEGGVGGFTEPLAPTLHVKADVGGLGVLVCEVVGIEEEDVALEPEEQKREKVRMRKRLVGAIDKALLWLPEKGGRGGLVVKPDTVDMETRSKRRVAPLVGVILLVLLGVSMVFGVQQRREKLYRARYEERLVGAIHQFEEAVELGELNRARARELVISAQTEARALEAEGVNDGRLSTLLVQIDDNLGQIAGIYRSEPSAFLELGLISSGFEGGRIVMNGEEMVVLDKMNRQVVSVDAGTKRTEVVAGPDYLGDAIDVAMYAGRVFVLSSDGVREVSDEVELVIKPEWDPDRILLAAFAGNMYILEKDEGKVWRYPGIRLGLADKQDWLYEGLKVDFGSAIAWAIDGQVWVLESDGRVMLFSRGSQQNFGLSGPGNEIYEFSDIYTDEEMGELYLLDSGMGRVVVFEKSGEYVGEYVSEKLKQANGVVVSEKEGKIIFLAENKLWEMGLGGL